VFGWGDGTTTSLGPTSNMFKEKKSGEWHWQEGDLRVGRRGEGLEISRKKLILWTRSTKCVGRLFAPLGHCL